MRCASIRVARSARAQEMARKTPATDWLVFTWQGSAKGPGAIFAAHYSRVGKTQSKDCNLDSSGLLASIVWDPVDRHIDRGRARDMEAVLPGRQVGCLEAISSEGCRRGEPGRFISG